MSVGFDRLRAWFRGPAGRRRVAMGVLTFALSFIPLVGTLGYFGCFVLSPIFAVFGVGVGIDAENESRPTSTVIGAALRDLAGLFIIALVVLTIAIAWNPNCDPWAGLAYFGYGPVCSGIAGATCGLWGARLGRRRLTKWLFGLAPMFGCIVVGLWRIYYDPVVYAFDPFFGWFSGPIYDESVGIGSRYRWFRFYNASAVLSALAAWHVARSVRGQLSLRALRGEARVVAIALGMGLVASSFGLRPTHWGFHSTIASIDKSLGANIESEHFVIHYAPRSSNALEIDAIVMEHEFAWHRLHAIVGEAPAAPDGKIHSFLFNDSKQKKRLFGAGNVEVSTPWRGHIYLTRRGYPHSVLHHELAHTFAGVWGDSFLKISRSGLSIDGGLIEGVAVALAPQSADGLDVHEQAAVLDRLKLRPSLTTIMGPGFWSQSASRAYVTAGSFCSWLLEQHGADKLGALYRSAGDYPATMGQELGELETQWLAFLRDDVVVRDEDVEAQRQRFKRRAVFRRPCAHRAASLRHAAGAARNRGDEERAIKHLLTLCSIEPKQPTHRLSLARSRAAAGDSAGALGEVDRAAAMNDLTDALLASIDQTRGDVAMAGGDMTTAAASYDQALGRALRETSRRTVQVKRAGAGADPETAALILDYFAPFAKQIPSSVQRVRLAALSIALAERPGFESIGEYLAARQLSGAALHAAALVRIQRANQPPLGVAPLPTLELRRASLFVELSLHVRARDRASAQRAWDAIAILEGEMSRGRATRLALWQNRIDFLTEYAAADAASG